MLDILPVDDEPELRDVLQELLLEAGHQVVTASNGVAGADNIRRRLFDVVICDVRLPQIDGLTLFRQIRKEATGTEVILMTAYSEVSQAVSALKEGAYDYLTNPFDKTLWEKRRGGSGPQPLDGHAWAPDARVGNS